MCDGILITVGSDSKPNGESGESGGGVTVLAPGSDSCCEKAIDEFLLSVMVDFTIG